MKDIVGLTFVALDTFLTEPQDGVMKLIQQGRLLEVVDVVDGYVDFILVSSPEDVYRVSLGKLYNHAKIDPPLTTIKR